MVHCLSCERYPKDLKVIPYGSEFPLELYKVRLLSSSLPNPMPTSGADVENLADKTKFAVGSLLYVVNGTNGSEVYIYNSNQFELWSTDSNVSGSENQSGETDNDIYCLSCEKYPKDAKVIPYGSTFPIDTFRVRLLSSYLPSPMPRSGADVVGLADKTKFAVGSKLYVIHGSKCSEVYVYENGQFVLWATWAGESHDDKYSDLVDIGQVDFMILTT